jgi:hypothetical protein
MHAVAEEDRIPGRWFIETYKHISRQVSADHAFSRSIKNLQR